MGRDERRPLRNQVAQADEAAPVGDQEVLRRRAELQRRQAVRCADQPCLEHLAERAAGERVDAELVQRLVESGSLACLQTHGGSEFRLKIV